eukprot:366506_1
MRSLERYYVSEVLRYSHQRTSLTFYLHSFVILSKQSNQTSYTFVKCMRVRIDLNVNSLIALIAKLALDYINNKVNQINMQGKENKNDPSNYNQNLLPNIDISLNNSINDNDSQNESKHESKSDSTKQLRNDSSNLVQLTQLTDPDDNYNYSPRRTKYITRSSLKSNKFDADISKNMFQNDNNDNRDTIQSKFKLGKSHVNYNKSPKKKKTANLQWSFPIVGHTDEKRNAIIANRDKTVYPEFYTVISPKKSFFNGKYQQTIDSYRVQDTPIINTAIIHKHPKSKKIPKKINNSTVNISPNSILSVLSHLDYNHLVSIDIKKNMRWKLSFIKLRKNTAISKTEILHIRNELCKPDPKIFLSGSTRKTPYEQWVKLNDFYISAQHNPPNKNSNHRNLSTLISKFCLKFNSITWNEFINHNFKLGYNPENWIWNEKTNIILPSPSDNQNQNTINLSPIQLDLLSPSPQMHSQPVLDEEKKMEISPKMISDFHAMLNENQNFKKHDNNPNVYYSQFNYSVPYDESNKNRILEFFDKIISEQSDHYKKQKSPIQLRLPIVIELLKFVVYYRIELNYKITQKFAIFFPEVYSLEFLNKKLNIISNNKNAKILSLKKEILLLNNKINNKSKEIEILRNEKKEIKEINIEKENKIEKLLLEIEKYSKNEIMCLEKEEKEKEKKKYRKIKRMNT